MAYRFEPSVGSRRRARRSNRTRRRDADPQALDFDWLRRFGGHLRPRRALQRAHPLAFEALEPRLLLAADFGAALTSLGDMTIASHAVSVVDVPAKQSLLGPTEP